MWMAFAPALSLVGSAVSGIVGAVGAVTSGIAQSNAARYQAGVARNNEIIAQQNAQYSAAAGGVGAQRQDMKNKAVLGAIEAGQGASGIDTGVGSPVTVREGAANVGRLDTETVMSNALAQTRSYTAAASNFEAQSQLDTMTAKNATTAGVLGAGSSLLGGASSFSDKWLRYQTEGVNVF
jgi:hypothetical protein